MRRTSSGRTCRMCCTDCGKAPIQLGAEPLTLSRSPRRNCMKTWQTLLVAALSLSAFTAVTEGQPMPNADPFTITTRRKDDEVKVQVAKDKATFVVTSPFGISHADIERRIDQ